MTAGAVAALEPLHEHYPQESNRPGKNAETTGRT